MNGKLIVSEVTELAAWKFLKAFGVTLQVEVREPKTMRPTAWTVFYMQHVVTGVTDLAAAIHQVLVMAGKLEIKEKK